MPFLYRVVIISLITVLLGGCFSFGSEEKELSPHYYIIDVDRGGVATAFAQHRVLLLKPVRVVPHFRGKNLMFRVGEDEYQPQAMDEFITDPQEMFTSQLRRWLEKSGLFTQVVTDDSVPADLVLEAAVTALYGEDRDKYSPKAVLEMQFFLSSAADNNHKVLFQTGYRIDADLDKTTPTTVVMGWKQGLITLLTTLEEDMSGYFAKVGGNQHNHD